VIASNATSSVKTILREYSSTVLEYSTVSLTESGKN